MEVIENLNDSQREQLLDLYNKTWFTPNRNMSEIKKMLINSYLTLGFTEKEKLIGFCRAISDGVYKAFLFDVIVDEDFQNQVIGKKIVEMTLNHKSLINVSHIELYCPEKISGFYKK